MSTEHLILGKTVDFITGKTIADTHDERARQKIARYLVHEKGYAKADIETRRKIVFELDGERATANVDFVVWVEGKVFAIVVFGPGSLVSRERSTLAAARLTEAYAVPYAVITNGKDAELLETKSGQVVSHGLDTIPSKADALKAIGSVAFDSLSEERLIKEKRILYAFEVLAERECDEYTCPL